MAQFNSHTNLLECKTLQRLICTSVCPSVRLFFLFLFFIEQSDEINQLHNKSIENNENRRNESIQCIYKRKSMKMTIVNQLHKRRMGRNKSYVMKESNAPIHIK